MIFHSASFWLSVSLICLIAEVVSLGFLFGAFSIAALLTALLTIWIKDVNLLFLIFGSLSLLTFVSLRPWYCEILLKKNPRNNLDFAHWLGKKHL